MALLFMSAMTALRHNERDIDGPAEPAKKLVTVYLCRDLHSPAVIGDRLPSPLSRCLHRDREIVGRHKPRINGDGNRQGVVQVKALPGLALN